MAATLPEFPPRSHTAMSVPVFPPWPADPALMSAAAAAGLAFGSLAGSFLNVVAHRVPRGQTVIFGRSRCPACQATIRSRDNVPVLGWLVLGGRCRDCGAAIPARYPLVEAGCGGLVAALAMAECAAAGGRPEVALAAGVGHGLVALTIVAWALLAERGHRVSGVTTLLATGAAAVAAAWLPGLHPLGLTCASGACDGGAACLVAAIAGAGAGWLAGAAGGRHAQAACGLVGAALGWQAALVAALAAGAGGRIWRHAAAAPLATLTAVACWHPIRWVWTGFCRAAAGA